MGMYTLSQECKLVLLLKSEVVVYTVEVSLKKKKLDYKMWPATHGLMPDETVICKGSVIS